jgi:hypothetical protein
MELVVLGIVGLVQFGVVTTLIKARRLITRIPQKQDKLCQTYESCSSFGLVVGENFDVVVGDCL